MYHTCPSIKQKIFNCSGQKQTAENGAHAVIRITEEIEHERLHGFSIHMAQARFAISDSSRKPW
jgi:hypothetical protein